MKQTVKAALLEATKSLGVSKDATNKATPSMNKKAALIAATQELGATPKYTQSFIGPMRLEDTPTGAIMAQNKAYEQARHNAIYGNTDVSNYQYQTVEEYDAEIAKLEKELNKTSVSHNVNPDVAPSVALAFATQNSPKRKKVLAQIDALKAQRNLLERAVFIGNKYGNIRSTADFDAKSGVTRHDEDMTYVAVNRDAYSQFPEEYNDIGWVDGGYVTTENMAELARKYGWSSKEATMRLASADDLRMKNEQRTAEIEAARKSNEFAMLTDDERAVYNYLYNVSGKNAANEYLDDMKHILEQRYSTAEQLDYIDRYDRAGDFGKAVMNIATIPANLVGALVAAINDVSEGVVGKYSPYGTAHTLQNYADTIRGETAADINEAVKNAGGSDTVAQLATVLYQGAMSGADAMLGGATLGSGYLAIAGMNAATHKAKELYESGAEGWQIALGSVASGALEAAIEKLPLDNLLAMKNTSGANSLSTILKNILKQSGLEGGEEAITELANLAADCILQGGNSDLSRQIAAYEHEGHSSEEARKMALRDKVSDVLWAAVAGMGSGGGSAAVFSSIGYGNMLRDTANLGRTFLDTEGGLDKALGIGLDNARTTQAYKSAQAMAQRVEDGKDVSAYQVGKMLRDSQTTEAQKARALDHAVRQSAVGFDVSDDVTDMVADIAAGTGRQIVFGDLSEFDGEIEHVGGQYDPETGVVTISSKATTEQVVNFLTKHEITHSIEGTQQWDQLADIVQAQLSDEKWSDAISEVMERYAANGKELDLPHAEYEVVADWIGKNLYKSGFAQAIVNGDATVGNTFVQAIDKIRLALGNKKSRSHTNLAVVERLFMRALENEVQTRAGSVVYFIAKGDNEIGIKEQLREHLDEINQMESVANINYHHTNKLAARQAVSEEFKKLGYQVDRQNFGIIQIGEKDIDVSVGYINTPAECAAWLAVPKVLKRGKLIHNRDNHKGRGHSTVTIAAPVVINGTPGVMGILVKETGKNHYKSHRILMPDGSAFVYQEMKNAEPTSASMIASKSDEGLAIGSASNTRLSQNDPRVNTQSMQNGKNNSSSRQLSFLSPEMAESGKPDVYQEEGEREAYLAEGNDTSSVTADAATPSPQGEGYDGAIDENGELDEDALNRMVEERKRTKAEAASLEANRALLAQFQNGEISEQTYLERVEDLRREAVRANDKQYRQGKRGSTEQKAAVKKLRHDVESGLEENYLLKEARLEAEHAERRDRERQRRESKERTEKRNQLNREIDSLQSRLLNPKDGRSVPKELVAPCTELLTALRENSNDADARLAELDEKIRKERDSDKYKRLQKQRDNLLERSKGLDTQLLRLKKLYAQYAQTDTIDGVPVESDAYAVVIKMIDLTIEQVGDRSIKDLSIEELRAVLRTVQSVAHTSADANRLHSKHFKEGVRETGLQMEQEARNNKTLSGGWARAMLAMQLNPDRFFDAMGDFAKDSAWKALGMEFADGQTKVLEINRDFHTLFADIINDKAFKGLASYKDADLVDVGVVDIDGKPVKITRGMMLALYQTITCPGNRQALIDGGIEIPNMKQYYEGKNIDAYAQSTRISRSSYCEAIHDILHQREQANDVDEIGRLTSELVRLEEQASAEYDAIAAKIEERMTDYEKRYCELMREWFDNVSKNHINDVTMDVFGFQKAIVEKYFPIYRDTNFVANEIDGLVSDITLESLGSLKSRVRSRAPIKLADVTDVLMRNERSIANYCGYLSPMTDMKKLLNVHTQDMRHSVKDSLVKMTAQGKSGIGTTPMEYIKNLMIDIAGGRQNENSLFSALRRNVIRSTMTFNPRVAVKQIGAVFTSAGELGWKYQSKAVQRIGRKLDPKMVAKYSVYFHERMYGSGGMEEFAAMKQGSNIFDRAYRKADDATKGKLFNWCQDMDNYVCNLLWFGCEAKIRDTRPELKPDTEEFYEAVGKELDRVIQKTQTNYTLMERSDLSRDTRWTMKILSTYKTDAIQGFNMLFEANARYRRYKKDLAAGKGGVTQADVDAAKQQLADTIPAVLVGNVLWGAFAGILMNLLMQRTSGVRDDNDEITAASVGKALLSETLGGMAGLVVFGDQVYDIAAARIFGDNYYGISDMGIETLSGLLEDFATGNFTKGKTIKYLLQDMGKVVGIPLKNAWDMGEGIAKHIEDLSKGEFLSLNASADTTPAQYYRRLHKALQKGDTETADSIREFLITGGKTEAEIQTGLRAAVKKTDKDYQKEFEAAMQEAMEDMFYRAMTEKEQKKVESGISGYIADQIVAERTGSELTKANQKAAGYIDEGASIAQYFVANAAKNAEFADKNRDDEVSKAEYRSVMSEAEYDEYLKQLFLKMK